jgi:hypothetical protein
MSELGPPVFRGGLLWALFAPQSGCVVRVQAALARRQHLSTGNNNHQLLAGRNTLDHEKSVGTGFSPLLEPPRGKC